MVKKSAYFGGFTLAEVMIVLTVIGILTAILLPIARQSMPNENLMKFKKAHNTLGTVIRELVISDKYYLDGDLGVKPNGDLIDGTHDGDKTYFCNTFADIISAKKIECKEVCSSEEKDIHTAIHPGRPQSWMFDIETAVVMFDNACKETESIVQGEITTSDNIVYYSTCPNLPYGTTFLTAWTHLGKQDDPDVGCTAHPSQADFCKARYYKTPYEEHLDPAGSPVFYKHFCIDIDGPNQGEDPFGYGIRFDGRIIAGKRAQEWLEKESLEE